MSIAEEIEAKTKRLHDEIAGVLRKMPKSSNVTVVTIASMHDEAAGQWILGAPEQLPTTVASRLRVAADCLHKQPAAILWCCHVRGPDDVYAAPDYETALAWSDIINAVNWRGLKGAIKPPDSYDDCLLKASPAPWPWSAEAHAENLPRSIADFAPRTTAHQQITSGDFLAETRRD